MNTNKTNLCQNCLETKKYYSKKIYGLMVLTIKLKIAQINIRISGNRILIWMSEKKSSKMTKSAKNVYENYIDVKK